MVKYSTVSVQEWHICLVCYPVFSEAEKIKYKGTKCCCVSASHLPKEPTDPTRHILCPLWSWVDLEGHITFFAPVLRWVDLEGLRISLKSLSSWVRYLNLNAVWAVCVCSGPHPATQYCQSITSFCGVFTSKFSYHISIKATRRRVI